MALQLFFAVTINSLRRIYCRKSHINMLVLYNRKRYKSTSYKYYSLQQKNKTLYKYTLNLEPWQQRNNRDSGLRPEHSLSYPPPERHFVSNRNRFNQEYIVSSPEQNSCPSDPIQIPTSALRRLQFDDNRRDEPSQDSGIYSPSSWRHESRCDNLNHCESGSFNSSIFVFEDSDFIQHSPSRRNCDLKCRLLPPPSPYYNLERMSSINEGYTTPSGSFKQSYANHFHRSSSLQSPSNHSYAPRTSSNSFQRNLSSPGYLQSSCEQRRTYSHSFTAATPVSECKTPTRSRTFSDASAPPLTFDIIQGYEKTTGWQSVYMYPPSTSPYCGFISPYEPPPPYEVMRNVDIESARSDVVDISTTTEYPTTTLMTPIHGRHPAERRCLTEEDIIDALTKFVSSNCCYNTNITKHMSTKEIRPTNGHQYVLETFYEERTTSWQQEPYTNQIIDGPENSSPPPPWSIYVPKPKMFIQKEMNLEVPHTASVKDCTNCHGKGKKRCTNCNGSGGVKCSACDGLGIQHQFNSEDISTLDSRSVHSKTRPCHHCNGGRKTCSHCMGDGVATCVTCKGNGSIKVYIRLTVKWKMMKSHKVLDRTKLPNECIAEVSGALVFQEQNDNVYPLLDFPVDEINNFSRQMIASHADQLQHARVIMQRHCVREVPVTEVRSQWKQHDFTFWVYGNENQVYCPDYPSKCFSGCSIL